MGIVHALRTAQAARIIERSAPRRLKLPPAPDVATAVAIHLQEALIDPDKCAPEQARRLLARTAVLAAGLVDSPGLLADLEDDDRQLIDGATRLVAQAHTPPAT